MRRIRKRLVSAFLVMTMLVPGFVLAQTGARPGTAANAQPAVEARQPAQNTTTQSRERVRPQSPSQRRSYEREAHGRRRHSGISKKEVAFMAAIAGTSMGIGAVATGAKGLAIGAIVGGWGAYAGHRVWKWVR
jgi:hypothetical protein